MRLQRFLAQSGVASRRNAEQLIASGAVRVNGVVVKTPGVEIESEHDMVEVDGRRVRRDAPVYRLLLKPRGCLSMLGPDKPNQHPSLLPLKPKPAPKLPTKPGRGPRPIAPASGRGRLTLAHFVPIPEPGLQVVAPLDFLAEGLLLLTSDGELADAIARKGKNRVPMIYHLKFQGVVNDENLARLLRGWRFEDSIIKPSRAELLATTGKNTWIEVIVPEIRPRALKAAGDVIRHSLLKISRVRFGGMSFEGLAMGEARDLSKAEAADLRNLAGLRN